MSETDSATAAEGTGTQAETTSEATLSIEWIRDFATRWIDACNSHEVDRVLALMSEDIEYRDDSWPKPMLGGSRRQLLWPRGGHNLAIVTDK